MPAKPLLNYTTQVSADKTIGEIQALLAKAGARSVLSEYDPEGEVTAISFRIETPAGLLTFRLPGNVQKIYQVLVRDRRIPPKFRTRAQASRVAWRILKTWLDAQLAIIQSEMVDLTQVFLPYVQNPETGKTLYEGLQEKHFTGLTLPGT